MLCRSAQGGRRTKATRPAQLGLIACLGVTSMYLRPRHELDVLGAGQEKNEKNSSAERSW